MKTTVLIFRHESREGEGVPMDALPQAAIKRAIRSGQRLKEMGHVIDIAVSSPKGRAIQTLHYNMVGMGYVAPLNTTPGLGDAVLGSHPFSKEELDTAKQVAKQRGVSVEEFILMDGGSALKIADRGREGGSAILYYVQSNQGKTIGVASHGGSRIETTIATLQDSDPASFPHLFEAGAVGVLEFEGMDLVSFEYLGNLGRE